MDQRWDETRAGAGRPMAAGTPEDTAAIRADIERTRARMSETVDELGYRLDPDRLKRQVKQNIHDATVGKAENMARHALYRADETRHSIVDTLRDNPVPAAMIGVGLGWLFVNGRRHEEREYHYDSRYDRDFQSRGGHFDPRYTNRDFGYRGGYGGTQAGYEDRWSSVSAQRYRAGIDARESFDSQDGGMRDRVDHLKDTARDSMHEARESISEAQDRVRDRAFELKEDARDRVTELAHETRDTVRDMADHARGFSHELADTTRRRADRVEDRFDSALHDTPLAIGAAAVAIGLAVGMAAPATRRESELMGGTRDQLLDRARDRAEEVGGRVRTVAERVADQVQATARDAVSEVKSTAREAAEEEGLTHSRMSHNDPFPSSGSTSGTGSSSGSVGGTAGTMGGGHFGSTDGTTGASSFGSTGGEGYSSEPSTARDAFRGSDMDRGTAGSANEPPFDSPRDDETFGDSTTRGSSSMD